ncbi:MAG: hypothetical protein E3J47_08245 [Candidatus Stahlbacteria bacterium]|nr:MAG: hypothetical protein E3J47_08245 [Candidatus Stahlbacteria bacterium]
MKNVLLLTFPKTITNYNGYYMLHVDNNLNVAGGRFTGCRETFCANIRHKHNGTRSGEGFSEINTNRLYVLITFGGRTSDTGLLDKMTRSLKLVNSFERYHKWPLSKIKPANDKRKSVDIPSVLFIANRKWGVSPYLVSLYTLLIRLGKYPWLTDTIVNEADHKTIVAKLKKVCSAKRNTFNDAMHIHKSINMANILISNYDELFKGKSKRYHWSTGKLNSSLYYNEGISLLAADQSKYKKLQKKCLELKKK